MKKMTFLMLIFFSINAFGQDNPTAMAKPIVEEGKRLYNSEMASWNGTDIFLEIYKNKENIGGYFSYAESETIKCVFFSRLVKPKVIGTISFDSTFSTKTAITNLLERDFTTVENDLFIIRKLALDAISSDTLFKSYKNTNFNLIPLINNGEKKVYVLTGPQQNGVVILGNDYLLTFDANNNMISKKQLHQNIISIKYGDKEDGKEVSGTIHTHLPETGDFITATDICTLMLYGKFTGWKQHNVVSKKYLNIWDCLTNRLLVVPRDILNKDQEKSNKQKAAE